MKTFPKARTSKQWHSEMPLKPTRPLHAAGVCVSLFTEIKLNYRAGQSPLKELRPVRPKGNFPFPGLGTRYTSQHRRVLDFWRFPHFHRPRTGYSQVNFNFYQAQDVKEPKAKVGLSAWWYILVLYVSLFSETIL